MGKKTGRDVPCRFCGTLVYRSAAHIRKSKSGEFACRKGCALAQLRITNVKSWARASVALAIKLGELIKPSSCSQCQSTGAVQAHHADHEKPLDVVWLCSQCHDKESRHARLENVERRRVHFDPCPCGEPAVAKGLCKACYAKKWKQDDSRGKCRFPDCDRSAHTRGLCSKHHQRKDAMEQYGLPKKRPGPKPKPKVKRRTWITRLADRIGSG